MNKEELFATTVSNYHKVINFVNQLSFEHLSYKEENKWTVSQHVQHLYLVLQPFSTVLISKEYILERFGFLSRKPWDYEILLEKYLTLDIAQEEPYLPDPDIGYDQIPEILSAIEKNLHHIGYLWKDYTEEDLNTLKLPHSSLGFLSLREHFYLLSYHPLHNLKIIMTLIGGKNKK